MLDTIQNTWRPSKKSSNALLKAGYSQAQLNDIGKTFIERYLNKQVQDASTKFTNMVRSSGIGHNVKQKPTSNNNQVMKDNLANKADNGAERAKEISKNNVTESMKLAAANMIQKRFGTGFAECREIVGLEVY